MAEITAAHNMFLDCKEAENSNVKAISKEMLSEAEFLHTKYTKFNVNPVLRWHCVFISVE